MSSQRIEIRVTPALRERLEELAATRKTTLSAAIKSAILEAAPLDEAVPSEDEVLRLLGQAARIGNVAAMKELRAYYREQSDEERAGRHPLAGVDELAQRRVDQAGGA